MTHQALRIQYLAVALLLVALSAALFDGPLSGDVLFVAYRSDGYARLWFGLCGVMIVLAFGSVVWPKAGLLVCVPLALLLAAGEANLLCRAVFHNAHPFYYPMYAVIIVLVLFVLASAAYLRSPRRIATFNGLSLFMACTVVASVPLGIP
jgi:hypothetical protein